MSRTSIPSYQPSSSTIAIPTLSLDEARVVLWYFQEGLKSPNTDRMCRDSACVEAMASLYKMHAYDAIAKLIENQHAPMLIFEPGRHEAQQHRLPEQCFLNPIPLFSAIRAAEQKHNDDIAHNATLDPKVKGSGYSHITAQKKPVPLTPMPDMSGPDQYGAAPQATTVGIGSVIMQEGRAMRLVEGKDGPELVEVPVKKAGGAASAAPGGKPTEAERSRARREAAKAAREAEKNAAPPADSTKPASVPAAPKNKTTRGHEAA